MLDTRSGGNPSGRHISDAFFAQTIHAERKARQKQSAKVLRQFKSRGNNRLSGLATGNRDPSYTGTRNAVKRKNGIVPNAMDGLARASSVEACWKPAQETPRGQSPSAPDRAGKH
jgi:hypothetical protein